MVPLEDIAPETRFIETLEDEETRWREAAGSGEAGALFKTLGSEAVGSEMAVERRVKEIKDDVDRLLDLERLRADLKRESHSAAWYAGKAVQGGSDLAYVSMRYGIPIEKLKAWKAEWERRAKDKSGDVGSNQVLRQARSAEGESSSPALFGDKDR